MHKSFNNVMWEKCDDSLPDDGRNDVKSHIRQVISVVSSKLPPIRQSMFVLAGISV